MKLKTRLAVTFLIITVVPMALIFFICGLAEQLPGKDILKGVWAFRAGGSLPLGEQFHADF